VSEYQAKFWEATEDPGLHLAKWLDEQVEQAVTEFVSNGFFTLETGGQICFFVADKQIDVTCCAALVDLVSIYLWRLEEGWSDRISVEQARQTREAFAAALAKIDATLK
jgi:hypothetical protein